MVKKILEEHFEASETEISWEETANLIFEFVDGELGELFNSESFSSCFQNVILNLLKDFKSNKLYRIKVCHFNLYLPSLF